MMQQNDLHGKQSRPSGENRATCWDAYISGRVKDAPTRKLRVGTMCVRARLLPSEYRKLTQSISEKKLLCTCCQEGMGDNGFLGADFHALRVARTAISDKGLRIGCSIPLGQHILLHSR